MIQDKRTHIIETAMGLFVTQGLQQTSMAQLSKESGVAVGTMYHHFGSKDELIEGIFLHIQEDFGRCIHLSEQELQLPFREKFNLVVFKTYQYYIQNPNYFFFVDTHNYSPLISQEITLKGRKFYQQSLDLLISGMEIGAFKKIHPNHMIRWVYNGIISLVQIRLCDQIEVDSTMLNQTCEMIWNGLQ